MLISYLFFKLGMICINSDWQHYTCTAAKYEMESVHLAKISMQIHANKNLCMDKKCSLFIPEYTVL